MAAYLDAKPTDIPGACPFTGGSRSGGGGGGGGGGRSSGGSGGCGGGGGGRSGGGGGGGVDDNNDSEQEDGVCPFGLRCRWAGTHAASPPPPPTPATPADPVAAAHPQVWSRGELTGGGAHPTHGRGLNSFTLQLNLSRV